MITVQLLGGACLRAGDTPLAGPPAQRHRIALLALVVASWPQPLSRDRAMALLWPERDAAGARRLLNLAVHVLRTALGEGVIASTGDGLVLDPSRVSCDLHALRVAIAAGDIDRVVRLYTGPLLDGFHLDESIEFGYWLDDRRRELAHAFVGALHALAQRQEREGDVHGLVGTCRRLVAAEPHSGAHARALMLALDAAGDRAAARQHAVEHARRLREDLELEPDPEVLALADELQRAPARRVASSPAAGSARAASVAVLPFRSLGGDPDNESFADGITEDVIAHLAKIRALAVISRSSVLPFRDRARPPREIGSALGVAAVLDGSVRRAGDRVRIVAQLNDTRTERQLWAETWDRGVADIFAIQTEVALHIAAALETELSPDERVRVARPPTTDMLAWHLCLQGRRREGTFTREAVLAAIDCFERAIARDPDFALAHARVAMAWAQLGETGLIAPEVAYGRAREAVAEALRLDPDLADAHGTLALLKAVDEFDWAGAEREFERALALSPGSADLLDLYGRVCAGVGRHDEAIAMLERAQELDPLAHRVDIVTALLRAGRLEEGLRRAQAAVELDPFDRSFATLGWAQFLTGRRNEGIAALERAVALSPGNTMWLGQLGEACGMAGDTARARAILAELEARARTEYVAPYHIAYVHVGLGEPDRALDYLERAVHERAGPVFGIKGSFLLEPLREHPRFRALLQRMHLA